MSKEMIQAFMREMRERHQDEINSVALPEGTEEYVLERIRAGDYDTLLFMLKLGYLMGLQTGFTAGQEGEEQSTVELVPGPLQA